MYILTKDNWDFLVGVWKGVWTTGCGSDNDGSMNRGSEPFEVGVPQKSSFLAGDVKSVGVGLAGSDRALGYIFGSIRPCAH